MTYESSEISVKGGQPVELYDIAMGTYHWYLTSAGYDIEYLGDDYESAPCECSEVRKTGDYPKDSVDLKIPRGHAIATVLVQGTTDQVISLTKYRGHGSDFIKEFTGYLTNFKFDDNSIPTCTFEPANSNMQTMGGRRRCMKMCSHKLYGYLCGINRESYKIVGVISTIDGVNITADEFGTVSVEEPEVYGDLTGLTGCIYDASSESSTAPSSSAFDDTVSHELTIPRHYWSSGGGTPQWISCQWTTAQIIKKVRIYKYLASDTYEFLMFNPKYFRIQGSDNGSSWTDIDAVYWEGDCQLYTGAGGQDTELLNTADTPWITVTLDNSNSYTYYRVYVFSNWGGLVTVIPEIEMLQAESAMSQHQFGAGGEIIVGNAHRTIISHNGTSIIIDRPFASNVMAGSYFTAYAGCNHTLDVCRERFDNVINFGGQPYLPVTNPYTRRNSLVS